ncbi:DUF6691 family protein [Acidimangrovimonas sediminis]|uniref:DUF6691 family protein n=1 Tax=Acidimangrovimonas sediminis TaxID=2056283 RepID=UPI000C7FDCBD|nr:DUF6691 family protein [Acidimangrovimonas sediminis]
MRLLISALSGGLFGLGLLISGMTDTAKVQGFLDLSRDWDPTLMFVLGGAMLPMLVAWRIAARRKRALIGTPIPAMPDQTLDGRLIAGSVLFGLGWALAGFCPGPAIASLGWSGTGGVVFVIAMFVGMVGHHLYTRRRRANCAA